MTKLSYPLNSFHGKGTKTMKTVKHIDDEQPETVNEHFEIIVKDRSIIESDFVEVTPADLPEWLDERLFNIGQEYYMGNLLGFSTAHLSGLIAILAVPDILEVLVYTKRSSTICLSYRRFVQTLLLMYALFRTDILGPDSKWFKALNVIRWKHATISKSRVKQGLHGIYQKDMAITQFGFIGYIFVCPEKIGLAYSTEEQKMGFNHFWRVTGYMLGITNRLNICRKTVAETTELCSRIGYEILAKHLRDPLPEFLQITSNSTNGLWYADFTLNHDAFMHLTYNLTGVKYSKRLGWYSHLNMKYREWLLYLCGAPYIGTVIRILFNHILAISYWLIKYYPVIPWLVFGKKNGQVCLYPNTG